MTKAKQIKEFEEYIREPEKVFDRVCSKLRFRGVIETFSKALDTAEQRGREKAENELKTRQFRLQQRYHEQGKCNICGGKLSPRSTWKCEKHRIMKNEAAKRRRLKN